MTKYEITFDLDYEDEIYYDPDEQNLEILCIDDDCFIDTFRTDEKVKEFEDWYNDSLDEEDKIKVNYLEYDSDGYGKGYIRIELEKPLQNENEFAREIVGYLFDNNGFPKISYRVEGITYEMYWDEYRQSPEEKRVNVDYDDSEYISSYTNLKINKLS